MYFSFFLPVILENPIKTVSVYLTLSVFPSRFFAVLYEKIKKNIIFFGIYNFIKLKYNLRKGMKFSHGQVPEPLL